MALRFHLDGADGRARATTVTLTHGLFRTPVFMPVGTKGAVSLVFQSLLSVNLVENERHEH